jgi:predicted alpha/beta hydrolase family esterase
MNRYRILIISGMGCAPVRRHNWYEWLEKELQKRNFYVILQQMPDPYAARESYWVPFICEKLEVDKNTILIGHNSGCQAIMRLIEKDKVYGVILVSACHTDLGSERERASEYYNRPWLVLWIFLLIDWLTDVFVGIGILCVKIQNGLFNSVHQLIHLFQ